MSDRSAWSRREIVAAGVAAAALGWPKQSSAAPAQQDAPRLPLLIYDCEKLGESFAKQIDELSPQIKLIREYKIDKSGTIDANVIFGGIGAGDLPRAKNLRWVQTPSAGVEGMCYPEFVESDIILTNAQGCYAPPIAEHVFGLLFGLTRHIAYHARGGGNDAAWPIELRGMTMGIIGLGGIGRETARRAKAMDLKVLAVDAEPMYGERFAMVDEIKLVDEGLESMLQRSDIVVMAAPNTPKSRGMLGEKQFAAMKKGAWFINVSRGKTVHTDALLAALKNGQLSGAGLDVTDPEPLPADHELRKMPNVIITPHIAGQSQFGRERMQAIFVENVRRFVNSLALLNLVDKKRGY